MAGIRFQLDRDKAREAIVFLASRLPGGVEKYMACKLLFLADKYHLVRYGRPITGDRYHAMPYGPAPTTLLDLINDLIEELGTDSELSSALKVDRSYQHPRLVAVAGPESIEPENLSQSDVEALETTILRFGSKTFGELKALTHEMVAYQRAWEKRGRKNSAPMAFEDFFEEDPDAIAGVLEEALEDSRLRTAFPLKTV